VLLEEHVYPGGAGVVKRGEREKESGARLEERPPIFL